MAVFYSFFSYLGKIGISEDWRGFLLGLEPMTAFALRLLIIPMLHIRNAVNVMMIALSMLVVALCSYLWALSIPSLIMLRIFHGAAFVLLVSAGMAIVVHLIPKEKSAQGFGIVSVGILVPYAVMPLITDYLLGYVHSEVRIYAGITVMALPGIILLEILRRRLKKLPFKDSRTLMRRPGKEDLKQNFRKAAISLILAVSLLIYFSYSTVFFFMKTYAGDAALGQAGMFFTIATLVMIGVRVLGGPFFDRFDKGLALIVFMFQLMLCFVFFGRAHTPSMFYLLAGYYGLCIGVILPMLNAALFLESSPSLRGLNTNLSLFMMDAGFFFSPYIGGVILAAGFSYRFLFDICAGLLTLSLALLMIFKFITPRRLEDT